MPPINSWVVVVASVEISVAASVPVLSAKASASAAETRPMVQVLARVSAGGRAELWQAALSVSFLVAPGPRLSASAEGLADLLPAVWCHWPEADLYREGLASPEPVGLVFPSAAWLAAWLNRAVSGTAWLLDGWVCRA